MIFLFPNEAKKNKKTKQPKSKPNKKKSKKTKKTKKKQQQQKTNNTQTNKNKINPPKQNIGGLVSLIFVLIEQFTIRTFSSSIFHFNKNEIVLLLIK